MQFGLQFVQEEIRKILENFIGSHSNADTLSAVNQTLKNCFLNHPLKPEFQAKFADDNHTKIIIVPMNEAALDIALGLKY